MGSTTLPLNAAHHNPLPQPPDFPSGFNGYRLGTGHLHPPAGLPFGVPPSLHALGTGMLTCCPSPTTFVLGLGPTNPTRINLASETSGFRRMRFARILRYSYRHSHFPALHRSSRYGFNAQGTLPYLPVPKNGYRGFGAMLSPVTLSAQEH